MIAISAGGRHSLALALPDSSQGPSQGRASTAGENGLLSMPASQSSGRRSPTGASEEYEYPAGGSSNEEEEDELLRKSLSCALGDLHGPAAA